MLWEKRRMISLPWQLRCFHLIRQKVYKKSEFLHMFHHTQVIISPIPNRQFLLHKGLLNMLIINKLWNETISITMPYILIHESHLVGGDGGKKNKLTVILFFQLFSSFCQHPSLVLSSVFFHIFKKTPTYFQICCYFFLLMIQSL